MMHDLGLPFHCTSSTSLLSSLHFVELCTVLQITFPLLVSAFESIES